MSNNVLVPIRHAIIDPAIHATLNDLAPIAFADAGTAGRDVPPYARAASGVRRYAGRLAIIQDDVNVIVILDDARQVGSVLLPPGPGGARAFDEYRGNKQQKMDLEACATLPDRRFVAFGSGSTRARERLVVLAPDGAARVVHGADLYAVLRSNLAFSGSELNVEGAVVVGDRLRLFQRGNGAPAGNLRAVNATCEFHLPEFLAWLDHGSPAPHLLDVIQYNLGASSGTPFTFTDAALMSDGRVAFLACAEASRDTYHDGDVLGSRFGVADGHDVRITDIVAGDGRAASIKLEGLEERPGKAAFFDVVADIDRSGMPAMIGRLEVQFDAC